MKLPQNRATLNRRQLIQAGLAGGVTLSVASKSFGMANDEIRLGFVACGGRARQHMKIFSKLEGVQIAALCDPDQGQVDAAAKSFPKAKQFTDVRELLDDPNIDAVVVATCNHWHCLASIWAMEAGKDVYVEKPLSHSQWEGDQTVKAARYYKRICQVGTQQRSDPMQAEIKKFLHEEKALGEIQSCRVNRYGVRGQIGKNAKPLTIPANVDYNMWLGPAQERPIYRNKLQYDWHWDFNTGSGEMGNWGVHVLDDARNNIFLDRITLPTRIMGAGGRVAWGDAGDTPNVHFVYFETGDIPTVIGLSNLKASPSAKGSPKHPGPGSGYIAYCEGGRYEGQRGSGAAFDKAGKLIKKFKGNGGNGVHHQNFIDCVRSRKASDLNTDVELGNASTGWCNLANIAFRAGQAFDPSAAAELAQEIPLFGTVHAEMKEHLKAHSVDLSELKLSPMLNFNPEENRFAGADAETANGFLKREYRKGFEIKELS